MTPFRTFAAVLTATFCLATVGSAQDKDLQKLLEQIDNEAKTPDTPPDQPPKPGQIAPKDKALDDLLESLGQTPDRPTASGKPETPPSDEQPDDADEPDEPDPAKLADEDEDLDEHLRRLLGRIDNRRDEDEGQSEGGPFSELVKKMREAEQRLAELDTGEGTRKTQKEIVEQLEAAIKQLRQMQGQGQGEPSEMRMAGQQEQGDQPGENPGTQPGGAPPTKPSTPEQNHAMANAKDTWGHLQSALREVMGNASRMLPLQGKEDLVNRYYESVAKRSASRQ